MSTQSLRKGITFVFFANALNLIFSLITNFLLPKYLSVDAYADIKTFQLITSYIGIVSLGCVDGLYLKYGGLDLHTVDSIELSNNISSFRASQFVLTIVSLIISIIVRKYVLVLVSLTIVSLNMAGCIKSLYQATGEFSRYARVTNYTAVLTFIANVGLLFVFSIRNHSYWYLVAYCIIDLLIWLYLEIELCHKYKKEIKLICFSLQELLSNIKLGFLLMLGNFTSIVLTSMDRWFVKGLFLKIDFAFYSFAVSIEGFLNVAVTPITITLYNYFCKEKNKEEIRKLFGAIEIFAVFLVSCCFPVKFILEIYIPKYLGSSNVLFILFASQVFYIIVKSVYVNLYKARGMQKRYFVKLISVIVFGFVINWVCYWVYPLIESFAFGTLLSAFYWFIISIPDFKDIGIGVMDCIYPVIAVVTLVLCGICLNSLLGFIVYTVSMIICTALFRKAYLSYLKHLMPSKLKRILHKI